MTFGIDDALSAAAAAINLTDTVVETVKRLRKEKKDQDLELLIEEVRITALRRIDEADLALVQFERMLIDTKRVDIDKRLADVIAATPFWRPDQQFRLSQIRNNINAMSDSIYSAGDDIEALLRCRGRVEEMGTAVVETAKRKHELHQRLLALEVRPRVHWDSASRARKAQRRAEIEHSGLTCGDRGRGELKLRRLTAKQSPERAEQF